MEFSRQEHWSVAFPFSRGSSQPRKSNRRLLHCRQILYSLRHQGREAIGHPLQYSCLENPLDRGAWWATIYGVTQSRTRLKRLSMHAYIGKGNGNPLQYSCLENPVDRGAWWAAIYGVTQSQTRLKRLSMHAYIGKGNGSPFQYSCLENPADRGAWWAAIYGVAQSRTQLKRLSSSSKATREALVIPWPWGYFGGGRGMDTLPPEHPGEALGQMPAKQVGICEHLLGRVLTAWGRGKVHLWARDPSYSW